MDADLSAFERCRRRFDDRHGRLPMPVPYDFCIGRGGPDLNHLQFRLSISEMSAMPP